MRIEEFDLEPGESVTRTARVHWLVFGLDMLPFAIAALLPFLVPPFVNYVAAHLPQGPYPVTFSIDLSESIVRLALGLWWLFLWTGAFTVFTRAHLNLWIVTSKRVVNIKQVGFFNRRVESFLLSHVQDITTEVRGLVPTIFGFGTVRVETAGEESRTFRMQGLPNPEAMRDLIIREIGLIHDTGARQ